MKKIDDRTPEQRKTHQWGVVARDRLLSEWGLAKDGYSRCAWACKPEHLDKVERWVRSRSEMKHVNVVDLHTYRPPKNTTHFRIYVVEDNHPALR